MYASIDEVLGKTGVSTKEIGVLIVNCSLFNPLPSLSAMIVNRYKLRGNIITYNLGGMGCSAGLISMDLARDLLQVCFLNLCSFLLFCYVFCYVVFDVHLSHVDSTQN